MGEGSAVRLARIYVIAVAMALVACTPRGSLDESGALATLTALALDETSGPVTMAQAKACPVTLPSAAGPSGPPRDAFFGWGASYGNGTLWVGGLWPHGIIVWFPPAVVDLILVRFATSVVGTLPVQAGSGQGLRRFPLLRCHGGDEGLPVSGRRHRVAGEDEPVRRELHLL